MFIPIAKLTHPTGFGVLDEKGTNPNTAAILEWVVALVFSFYVLSFIIDLLPAVRTHHHMSHPAVAEMGAYGGASGTNGYVEAFPPAAFEDGTFEHGGTRGPARNF